VGRPETARRHPGAESLTSGRFLNVAFNVPVPRDFTYLAPEGEDVPIGARVVAPFGARSLAGFVVGHTDSPPAGVKKIKSITRVVNAEPLFDKAYLELAGWVSRMYFSSLGETLAAMIPSGRRETSVPGFGTADDAPAPAGLTLSEEQSRALESILESESGIHYLFGVTGSGKTEVFLQAAERVIARGRSVIYLVPEIALTHQLLDSVRHRFRDAVAVLHSRLTPSQRLTEWRRIRRGEARLVIGARSAVFAPVPRLGLIVVDEEHDGSYKSGSAPRYHARQVAMKRAADEGACLVFGTATPSVESWHLMGEGRIRRYDLTRRLAGGAMPRLEIIDLSRHEGPLSRPLIDALRETREEGRQSILFLNRRGFAHFFRCGSCGHEMTCANCSVGLTYHKSRNVMVCHYCGYRTRPVSVCPECGSLDVGSAGFGTERIEEDLSRMFPDWRIRRLDTDSTRRKGELEKTIGSFRDGSIDVLLGTQMVAKGLNFPGVKLVGIVSADTGLHMPDFRSAERTFALVVQVAGRAGRFHPDGRVLVQTLQPDNPAVRFAVENDLEAFYDSELAVRRELGFPPFARLIRIVVRARDQNQVARTAAAIARAFRSAQVGDEILGPAECPLAMVNNNSREQVIVRTTRFGPTHEGIAHVLPTIELPSGVYLEVDVDPTSLL